MNTTTIQPYMDALSAQKAQLEAYATRGFQAIAIPTLFDVSAEKSNFLTKSAIVFLVIGIIAFVVGLFTNFAIIVVGCTALLTAAYLYAHGRMDIKQSIYNEAGSRLVSEITSVVNTVKSEWNSFITKQNDALKKEVVSSTDTADNKVSIIDKIDNTPEVNVNLTDLESKISSVPEGTSKSVYSGYIQTASKMVQDAIDAADGAQTGIYNAISK